MQNFKNRFNQNSSLLEEIFSEMFPSKEYLFLEISMTGLDSEFGYVYELDAVGKRIEECLKKIAIPGIKETTVKRSRDAEIILELELEAPQVMLNRNRGNRYRDAIGLALEKCERWFTQVNVEGMEGVNNRIVTGVKSRAGNRDRYVDIRLRDEKSGKMVNIEIKRGQSKYHDIQKRKDGWMERYRLGKTYVVRGTPARRTR